MEKGIGIVGLDLIRRSAPGLKASSAIAATALLIASASLVWSPRVEAQKNERVRVTDSILGVRLGSTLEEAREKLKGLTKTGGEGEGEREGEREGGRKEAWVLKKSAFTSIAYQTDERGRVQWVTGFVRPGHEIPFSNLGDLSHASHKSEQAVIWNVQRPEGNMRVIARGSAWKARVVQVLSLNAPPLP
ncbi:MAG: hypothetical protein QOF61_2096 [Acidobacteriota bacterium]|nr:hypothetical protein [Acidobacteriota bacterium]